MNPSWSTGGPKRRSRTDGDGPLTELGRSTDFRWEKLMETGLTSARKFFGCPHGRLLSSRIEVFCRWKILPPRSHSPKNDPSYKSIWTSIFSLAMIKIPSQIIVWFLFDPHLAPKSTSKSSKSPKNILQDSISRILHLRISSESPRVPDSPRLPRHFPTLFFTSAVARPTARARCRCGRAHRCRASRPSRPMAWRWAPWRYWDATPSRSGRCLHQGPDGTWWNHGESMTET